MGVVLGLALAAGLFFVSRASFRHVRADDNGRGLVFASLSLLGRLLAATVSLWAYKNAAPSGFTPFALSLAGGFLAMYTVELVRYAGLHRYGRSLGARQ